MKHPQIYEDWIEHKNRVKVNPNFADRVMKQIRQHEHSRQSLFDMHCLLDAITAHPFVQAAMIAVAACVGVIRLAIMLHLMLYT